MKKALLGSVVAVLLALSFVGEMRSVAIFSGQTDRDNWTSENTAAESSVPTKRIAIISGFVSQAPAVGPPPRVSDSLMDHMLNKVCYADLWGYDFIFNTTWGFDRNTKGRHWISYGTWHRVPHMIAAMDQGYEWVLYADTDFVIQDIGLPLESFFKEWELYGKNNVHVFVPTDGFPLFTFSAFAVLIRNSPFGRRLLENWMELANGLCPNGNFESIPGKYSWTDSDQPGIWYALAKTHSDFYASADEKYQVFCNETTGLVQTNRVLGPELNQYFNRMGGKRGNSHMELANVPEGTYHYSCYIDKNSVLNDANVGLTLVWYGMEPDQPIIWSTKDAHGRGGLGVQQTFGEFSKVDKKQWFALHRMHNLTEDMLVDLEMCRKIRGCFAHYTDSGEFVYGCNRLNHTNVNETAAGVQ